jgi:hypothetical protein
LTATGNIAQWHCLAVCQGYRLMERINEAMDWISKRVRADLSPFPMRRQLSRNKIFGELRIALQKLHRCRINLLATGLRLQPSIYGLPPLKILLQLRHLLAEYLCGWTEQAAAGQQCPAQRCRRLPPAAALSEEVTEAR